MLGGAPLGSGCDSGPFLFIWDCVLQVWCAGGPGWRGCAPSQPPAWPALHAVPLPAHPLPEPRLPAVFPRPPGCCGGWEACMAAAPFLLLSLLRCLLFLFLLGAELQHCNWFVTDCTRSAWITTNAHCHALYRVHPRLMQLPAPTSYLQRRQFCQALPSEALQPRPIAPLQPPISTPLAVRLAVVQPAEAAAAHATCPTRRPGLTDTQLKLHEPAAVWLRHGGRRFGSSAYSHNGSSPCRSACEFGTSSTLHPAAQQLGAKAAMFAAGWPTCRSAGAGKNDLAAKPSTLAADVLGCLASIYHQPKLVHAAVCPSSPPVLCMCSGCGGPHRKRRRELRRGPRRLQARMSRRSAAWTRMRW